MEAEKDLRTLKDSEVQLDEVPFCKSIFLHGFPNDITEEDIDSAVRSVAGPLSIDKIDYKDGDGFAIVTFKKTSGKTHIYHDVCWFCFR